MKNIFLCQIACLLLLAGCKKVLDKPDLSGVSPDIWNNYPAASLYINDLYQRSFLISGFGANASLSEENQVSSQTSADGKLVYGTVGVNDVGTFSLAAYERIRRINVAIESMEGSTLGNADKGKLIGQAYFLRAWEYWLMVRHYGGMPMVLKALNPYTDDLGTPRSSTTESINIIVDDLDKAIAGLPTEWPGEEVGRITRGAASAMKGRILLFWASPQFNPANEAARWERAYQANKEAKSLLTTLMGRALHPSFRDIFLLEGLGSSANKEAILVRPFNYDAGVTHTWENSARPREVGNNGGNVNPTLGLVNAFPMKNGKAITDPQSGYDPVHFWKDRDPRFYATIVYNGAVYEFPGITGGVGRKQWHYGWYDNTTFRSVETAGPTPTGFYTRKMVNPAIAQSQVALAATDWIEIRLAEVLLNLAEAAGETNRTDEAYTELKAIRQRAGIEAGTDRNYGLAPAMSKDAMRLAVMQERQIELAYEDKRYWDIRRRNLFEQHLPGTSNTRLNGTRRLGIRTVLKPGVTNAMFLGVRNTINLDTEYNTYFRRDTIVLDNLNINYRQPANPGPNNPSYNFFGLNVSLLNRSPKIKQTLGWGDTDTFNPLQ